jgi:LCP family protein required for cell wall assembly
MMEHNRRPVKRSRKIVLSSLSVLLIAFISLGSVVFAIGAGLKRYDPGVFRDYTEIWNEPHDPTESSILDETDSLPSVELPDTALRSDKDVQNILIIGEDEKKKGDVPRSDSMILVSVDNRNKQIKMTSFLRDCYVHLPGYGDNRINAAYSVGGISLTIKTIEENFKIKIDNYVIIDFSAFEKIINRMGGISAKLTKAQAEYMTYYCHHAFSEGSNRLNGADALEYVRMRRLDSDFQRTARQRAVIEQLAGKIKKYNVVDLKRLMDDMLPAISTNLSVPELGGFVADAQVLTGYEIKQFSIPAEGTYEGKSVNGKDVLVLDVKSNADKLSKFIYTADYTPIKKK